MKWAIAVAQVARLMDDTLAGVTRLSMAPPLDCLVMCMG